MTGEAGDKMTAGRSDWWMKRFEKRRVAIPGAAEPSLSTLRRETALRSHTEMIPDTSESRELRKQ